MKAVYESYIEIVIHDVFDESRHNALEYAFELDLLRRGYPEDTQERAILECLIQRALQASTDGKDGYIGAYTNCAFSVLYEIFGVDVIAFLFNQSWIPNKIIDPFFPDQFLDRLAVLESALGKLTEGDALPILLNQAESYRWPRASPTLSLFLDGKHGLLARYSLHQLRDFGELGMRLQRTLDNLTVDINIFNSSEEGYAEEILACVAPPAKQELPLATRLIQ
jgi:hypothetical protein